MPKKAYALRGTSIARVTNITTNGNYFNFDLDNGRSELITRITLSGWFKDQRPLPKKIDNQELKQWVEGKVGGIYPSPYNMNLLIPSGERRLLDSSKLKQVCNYLYYTPDHITIVCIAEKEMIYGWRYSPETSPSE
jgi:hypothetical protein